MGGISGCLGIHRPLEKGGDPIGKHWFLGSSRVRLSFRGSFASLKSPNPWEVPLQEPMFRTSWVLKRMQWKPEIFLLNINDTNLATIPQWNTVSKPLFLVSMWNFWRRARNYSVLKLLKHVYILTCHWCVVSYINSQLLIICHMHHVTPTFSMYLTCRTEWIWDCASWTEIPAENIANNIR